MQTAETAAKAGLEFHFEKAIPTNTLDAHRLLHLAKESGHQSALKERLLKAHFTEGADLSDHATLKKFAVETGVDGSTVDAVLSSDRYRNEANADA